MIKFSIGGKSLDPNNITDFLMKAVMEKMRANITEKIGAIRDPDTGEFPTVIIRGDDIEHLTLHVEGSDKLIALVKERLEIVDEDPASEAKEPTKVPQVFLSYSFDDSEIAEKVATALNAKGLETFWAQWCISPGDSLRQKIDEGLSACTHFVVLLTQNSVQRPWVNQEMDAGLVRKLNDQCRFIPLRHNLPASALPPLLSGMLSPEISSDADISQLISDIYGISRKPPLGKPPELLAHSQRVGSRYSAAALSIAKIFVERSKNGEFADPQIGFDELVHDSGLSVDDTNDALHEISAFVDHRKYIGNNGIILAKGSFFAEFDHFWKSWNPAEDAIKIALDLQNDKNFPHDPYAITQLYGWEPRRLNPAIFYLLERRFIVDYSSIGVSPFAIIRIEGNDNLRRFLKNRSL